MEDWEIELMQTPNTIPSAKKRIKQLWLGER